MRVAAGAVFGALARRRRHGSSLLLPKRAPKSLWEGATQQAITHSVMQAVHYIWLADLSENRKSLFLLVEACSTCMPWACPEKEKIFFESFRVLT